MSKRVPTGSDLHKATRAGFFVSHPWTVQSSFIRKSWSVHRTSGHRCHRACAEGMPFASSVNSHPDATTPDSETNQC